MEPAKAKTYRERVREIADYRGYVTTAAARAGIRQPGAHEALDATDLGQMPIYPDRTPQGHFDRGGPNT